MYFYFTFNEYFQFYPWSSWCVLCSHWSKQDSQALWMKASSSWCTVCPGLLEKNISKPWKVSFLDLAAFIWQQQQNVLLFFSRLNASFFFYRGSEKSSERGNTSVSSENLLLVSPTFASYSAFSLQFSLSSALLPFLASGELYRIVGATPVQAGDTFKSTKVLRIVQINA